jgi:hypothetical protein
LKHPRSRRASATGDTSTDEALHVLAVRSTGRSLLRSAGHLHLRKRVAGRLHLGSAGLSCHGALLRHDLRSSLHGCPHVASALLHRTALSERLECLLRALLLGKSRKLRRRRRTALGLRGEAIQRILAKLRGAALLFAGLVQAKQGADALGDNRRKRGDSRSGRDRKWVDSHDYS